MSLLSRMGDIPLPQDPAPYQTGEQVRYYDLATGEERQGWVRRIHNAQDPPGRWYTITPESDTNLEDYRLIRVLHYSLVERTNDGRFVFQFNHPPPPQQQGGKTRRRRRSRRNRRSLKNRRRH